MTTFDADVGVVGAGPLGLELAVALKRAGISYVQWEAGQIGSTMQWWAPGTRWFSSAERIAIAGVPLETAFQEKTTREEYLAYLRGIMGQFGLVVRTYERVMTITRPGDATSKGVTADSGFIVRTERRGAACDTCVRRLVLVTGGTARPKLLGIPGEDLPHVSHYFQDPHTYFGQKLLIVGGRNSAAEAALRCHRAGADVAFSYRRAGLDAKDIKYWLFPELETLLKIGKIRGHFSTVPVEITPGAVRLRRVLDGAESLVEADFVLLMTGYAADMELFRQAGVELSADRQRPAYSEATMETNVPGLYVAGTAVAGTQEKYRVFLENCHVHVTRIVAALQGRAVDVIPAATYARPET